MAEHTITNLCHVTILCCCCCCCFSHLKPTYVSFNKSVISATIVPNLEYLIVANYKRTKRFIKSNPISDDRQVTTPGQATPSSTAWDYH